MPNSDNPKLRILYIRDYFEQHSGKSNLIRASELAEMLQTRYGISCDRKTVYSDIQALQDYGMDIIALPGKNGGYYLASRSGFTSAELNLLIDAVLCSRYLTKQMCKTLTDKLYALSPSEDVKSMRESVIVFDRVRNMNNSIYSNIDSIREAISQQRQITFRYFDWSIGGEKVYREKSYAASPYALYQDNANCYLIAHSERHGATNYRVDRMECIHVTDKARIYCPELSETKIRAYIASKFQMFNSEKSVAVMLRFHRDLTNAVFDRFGRGVTLIPDGDTHFTFTVTVDVSPMFLSWVFGFAEKAQILGPQSVVEAYEKQCRAALAQCQAAKNDSNTASHTARTASV